MIVGYILPGSDIRSVFNGWNHDRLDHISEPYCTMRLDQRNENLSGKEDYARWWTPVSISIRAINRQFKG